MSWIQVEDALPLFTLPVFVAGHYIPPDTGYPKAFLCRCRFRGPTNQPHFESNEWRGSVAITHWWLEEDDQSITRKAFNSYQFKQEALATLNRRGYL